jgi:hypothetical protein
MKLAQYAPLFQQWLRENIAVEPTETWPLWYAGMCTAKISEPAAAARQKETPFERESREEADHRPE